MTKMKTTLLAILATFGLLFSSAVVAAPAQAVSATVVFAGRDSNAFPISGTPQATYIKLYLHPNNTPSTLAFGKSRTANFNMVCPQAKNYMIIVVSSAGTKRPTTGTCAYINTGGTHKVYQYVAYKAA